MPTCFHCLLIISVGKLLSREISVEHKGENNSKDVVNFRYLKYIRVCSVVLAHHRQH